jgi:feruloyl esterase
VRRVWQDADGVALIEEYEIAGMAHGVPLDPGTGEGQSGEAGAHMLDVGLSSTDRIAGFFGIAPTAGAETGMVPPAPRRASGSPPPGAKPARPPGHPVQQVIEDALRAAGLMK